VSRYCWYPDKSLDDGAIEQAIQVLPGIHDFSALAKRSDLGDNTVCEIQETKWERKPPGYSFQVTANRFLPQMVRRILATLIDVGSMKCKPSLLGNILNGGRDSWPQPWVAPPQGLFLRSVGY